MRGAVALSGLGSRGRRNALALRLEHHELVLGSLPVELDGLRILQVADPHWSERRDAARESALVRLAADTPHDVSVLTGDYRDRGFGPCDGALAALRALREVLPPRVQAVFGNHDPWRLHDPMRAMGIDVLVNSHAILAFPERGGAALAVAGIDDPAYYRLHDVGAALRGVPRDVAVLLLAHSPAVADHVASAHPRVDACLSGHTHGGQFALPNGTPLARHRGVPPDVASGAWSRARTGGGTLHGYTSRGVGTSVADARFFCPPELTLHTLRAPRAPRTDEGGRATSA